MINDSIPWRAELQRIAQRLAHKMVQRRWVENSTFLVERDLMVGFFSVRRLIEAQKTSSLLPSRRIMVGVLPLTGREPLHIDRWSPWDFYDFESRQRSELSLGNLLQEVVHSFVLTLAFDNINVMTGVYVGSDRTKRKCIYLVEMRDIIDLFDFVSREDVVWWTDRRISGGGSTSFRLSQHDLVDAGFANYIDSEHYWHERVAPVSTGYLRAVFPDAPGLRGEPLAADGR